MSSYVQSLPVELIKEIVMLLSHQDLARIIQTCHQLYQIANEDLIWKKKGLCKVSPKKSSYAGEVNAAPSARLCHTATSHDDILYVYGGHTTSGSSQQFGEVKNDLHTYNLASGSWKKYSVDCAPAKTEHSTVFYDNRLWIFGGYSGTTFSNTLFSISTENLRCLPIIGVGDIPTGRSAHVGAVYKNKMYIFGGWNGLIQNNNFYSFCFDTSIWKMIQSNVSPSARCSHSAACSSSRGILYVFGGFNGVNRTYLNDLWAFHFDTMTWELIPARGNVPSPRSRMRMVEWEDKLYILGGWDKNNHFQDLYQFDIESRTFSKIDMGTSCIGIGQHSMTACDNILYVFAGYNSEIQSPTNDMYTFRLGKQSLESSSKREKPCGVGAIEPTMFTKIFKAIQGK